MVKAAVCPSRPMYLFTSGSTLSLSCSSMGDESCSEVSSSSPVTSGGQPSPHSPPPLVGGAMSPIASLSPEIGDVNLEFWDLDINSHSPPHGLSSSTVRCIGSLSDTSSHSGREDMSSPLSLTGYSVDSVNDGKKKKGPATRQQEELCLVCADRASGYHYNALTCEGCKGFFRRSVTRNAVYQCKYGKNCEMDMYMRRKCQECRLKKCLSVGMRPECVVPEQQCLVKREAKKAKVKSNRKEISSQSPVAVDGNSPEIPGPLSTNRVLSPEQDELIQRLVYFQEKYEEPSKVELDNLAESGICTDNPEGKLKLITDMTEYTIHLIVEFSKQLPGFDTLLREDQINLLKASSSEVMTMRAARKYDADSDTIIFGNSYPYSREHYYMAGLDVTVGPLFKFCRQMYKMRVDNAEYALLTAITIFSERPQLVEVRKVEKIQLIYLEALRAYEESKPHASKPMHFGKLLNVLTELRTLGNLNSHVCFSLKLKKKELPPFLVELWDVQP
ncbi:ecdysone receptor-like isoform X2 [Oratosquilla oratoria]|uniref:ecdysone receptor-like isoform X2 n=1 Tax=Oratosquilla oratoria TaxID=337810 RepID=UPI003F75BDD5